jgi:hypothetical protein
MRRTLLAHSTMLLARTVTRKVAGVRSQKAVTKKGVSVKIAELAEAEHLS